MKKNIVKTILTLALAASCLCSSCGLLGGNNSSSSSSSDSSSVTPPTPKPPTVKVVANTTDLDYKPENTDIVLAENGKSDYKIVIARMHPEGQTNLQFAANELQYFFKEATGVTLPIINDANLSFDKNAKLIVLGENNVSKGSGMKLTYEEFGKDGSHIRKIGNTLLINSCYTAGTKYGVYAFLWYNLGIKIYAKEEIVIPDLTNTTLYLKNFNYKHIPDIAERTSNINGRFGEDTCYRLGNDKGTGENWYAWCHTTFQLLPKSKYFSTNPDFYSPAGTQLCLTNDKMIKELTNVIKGKINNGGARLNTPGFFQIGIEDNTAYCTCGNCTQAMEENGGFGGVQMLFINKVADIMNPWMRKEHPTVEPIKWVVFAYAAATEAPVKELQDGTYVPYNDEVVAHDNVGIMYAPLRANYAYNLTDKENNEKFERMLNGYKTLGAETYVYTYHYTYDKYFYFLDNLSMLKDQYQTWQDMNTVYIYSEGASTLGKASKPFVELYDYIDAKLMWDVDADLEYYINDFISAYYKEASPFVLQYFNRVRSHTRTLERKAIEEERPFRLTTYFFPYGGVDRGEATEVHSQDHWSMDWLLGGIEILDKALAEVEKLPDSAQKELLKKRVEKERLSPIYILLDLYINELSQKEISYYTAEFVSGCEENGITYTAQRVTVEEEVGTWRSYLSD